MTKKNYITASSIPVSTISPHPCPFLDSKTVAKQTVKNNFITSLVKMRVMKKKKKKLKKPKKIKN